MATNENYQDAIMRMYDFCIASNHPAHIKEQFTQDLDFLAKLAEEHFEEKQETNIEHYYEYLSEVGLGGFALVNGRFTKCLGTRCNECDFGGSDCCDKKLRWLASTYIKKYKLTQFEYDLINTFDRCKECCLLNEIECLKKLRDKGYFKCADYDTKVSDILANCEVIK